MRNHVFAYDKSMMIIHSSQCMIGEDESLLEVTKTHKQRATLVAGVMAASMIGGVGIANAAIVSTCAGVSLPPSVVTNIVGAAVLPLTSTLDGALFLLLGPLGLSSNLNSTLTSIASGAPINLNVLDTNGNIVASNAPCQTTSDSFTLNTPKGISIGGNQITGLGNGVTANAGEMNSIAFGNGASTNALATSSIAIGPNASIGALGVNSMAIGSGTSVNVANSVALGAGSTATTGAESNYTAYGLTPTQTSVGEVSVGSSGNTRKITNVAAGSAATDAVNVSQLQAVDEGAVKYDSLSLKMTVTLGGPLSVDGGTTGGTRITNLSKGAVNATSTDAVNGSQLFGITSGMTSNIDALGLSMATNLGGGATYNSTTGAVSVPTYNVYGTTQNNVGSAITALQGNAPLQYSNSAGVATPNTPSNDVTLVGSALGPVTIHNVANGVAANDAVNMSQLDAMGNNVSNLDALAVKYDGASKDTITLAGPTDGTTITNLHQGLLSATSTDAVNGSQLYATNQAITNMSNGGGMKYFHANSTQADSAAMGIDSVAIGSRSMASGVASIAMGDNSQATNTGAIAIGQDSISSGVNSIAIGTGAVATGSVAVGVGRKPVTAVQLLVIMQ